jgi:uncharacterized protein (TIGR00297 family)
MDVLTLDLKGIILAFFLAGIMLYLSVFTIGGLTLGWFFVASMVYFLALAAIATKTGMNYKRIIKQYQKARGIKNVLANGLGPLIFVILVVTMGSSLTLVNAVVIGFISSVAAVTADKFSSEIGILDGHPRSIMTRKYVSKGVSGGITNVGLFAALIGAVCIALVLVIGYVLWIAPSMNSMPVGGICMGRCPILAASNPTVAMVLIVTFAGFLGSIIDSFLGYYEEKGIGNKYTSNFVCSVAGGLVGILLYLIFV